MIRYLVLFTLLAGVVLSNPCKNVKTGQKLQDPTECRGYILCHKGRPFMRSCTFGTKFNEAQQKCVRGKCPPCNCPPVTAPPTTEGSTESTRPPSTEGSTESPSTERSTESSWSPSTEPSPEPSTARPRKVPTFEVHCESHLNGKQIPDPKDCSKYWVCVYDTPVKKECPAGLWYDENLLVCNRPESAKCTAAVYYKQK